MNKKFLLAVLPLSLLLSSCGEVNFGFVQGDKHSAGFDKSVSSQNNEKLSYSYMSNTSLDNSGLTSFEVTFANMKESESDIQDVEKITSYFVFDEAKMSVAVSSPRYVGVKKDGPFFIGAESTYIDGEVTLTLDKDIKNVEITAKPYFYVTTAYNQDTLVNDSDVAISVNGSGFIRLEEKRDEEKSDMAPTVCAYHLNEESKTVTIKVGKRRAIIEKITLYY